MNYIQKQFFYRKHLALHNKSKPKYHTFIFMLNFFRRIPFFNRLIRISIKKAYKFTEYLTFRWRVSGILSFTFMSYKVNFYAKADDGIADNFYYEKIYTEQTDLVLFINFAKNARVILDVGANTGIYSLFSGVANRNAQIYAFEPNPINQKRLYKNINLNQLSHITVLEKAVGDNNRIVTFTIPEADIISDTSSVMGNFSKSTYKGKMKWKEVEVEQITLDSIFQDKNDIDLVKIDVESYEMSLFDGAKQTFTQNSAIIICEIFLDNERKEYFEKFLYDFGYIAYIPLQDGILKLGKKMIPNENGHNFIFAKGETTEVFTFYHDLDKLYHDLKN